MSGAERWAQIGEIFHGAMERRDEDRSRFLDSACGDDAGLRAEVESLLAAGEGAGAARLDDLAQGPWSGLLEMPLGKPERLGPWRVLGEIGRGGMGVVYDARREGGEFEQRAAIKLIQRGSGSQQILGRFIRERRIVARMEHPGIARFLDGGVDEAGRPWFALERVDGSTLTDHCAERALGLDARLDLFADVCRVVEYAHRSLVIHCDLKPANILVDREGHVRLLDFGIAKVLWEHGASEETRDGERPKTPGYCAPELFDGAATATTTDVYSLGIVLMELVAGGGLEPPRGFDPTAWGTALGGAMERTKVDVDLRRIAALATHPDPEQRYASVEALRRDLGRYRRGQPVAAAPDSWGYRAGKFFGRHRAGVLAGGLVVLALVVGLGGALWQAQVAARERDVARQEAEQNEQVKTFIVDLFRSSDPGDPSDPTLTVQAVLERGLDRVRSNLEDRPDLQVELLIAVGEVSTSLGDFAAAQGYFEEAVAAELGPSDRDRRRLAVALTGLGEVKAHLGEAAAAVVHYREAQAIRARHGGAESLEAAETENRLGVALAMNRDVDAAIEAYGRALVILERELGRDAPEFLKTRANLATAYRIRGDYLRAQATYREVIDATVRRGRDRHPHMVSYLYELAAISRRLGDLIEQERLLIQGVELSRELWGENHPTTLTGVNNYALVAHNLGRDRVAEELMRQVLAADIEQYGPDHSYVASSRGALARVLVELGRTDEALRELEAAGRILAAADLGPFGLSLHERGFAEALLAAGEVGRAVARADRALELERSSEPSSPEQQTLIFGTAAEVKAAAGDPGAIELYAKALAVHRDHLGEEHPNFPRLLSGLGRLHLARGEHGAAAKALGQALDRFRAFLPPEHWRAAEVEAALGELAVRRGGRVEGLEALDQAIARLAHDRGADHWRTRAWAARRRAVVELGI
ncbi:MAG: tetratricopeptide repeat protein [Acidobacteriota bacterium]